MKSSHLKKYNIVQRLSYVPRYLFVLHDSLRRLCSITPSILCIRAFVWALSYVDWTSLQNGRDGCWTCRRYLSKLNSLWELCYHSCKNYYVDSKSQYHCSIKQLGLALSVELWNIIVMALCKFEDEAVVRWFETSSKSAHMTGINTVLISWVFLTNSLHYGTDFFWKLSAFRTRKKQFFLATLRFWGRCYRSSI